MKTNPILFVVVATLATLACQTERNHDAVSPGERPRAVEPAHGKPEAPVELTVNVAGSVAHVSARFTQAGRAVRIRVDGVRGLAIKGDKLLADAISVAAGQTLEFDVQVADGPGASLLVVDVRGSFGAGQRATVRTFPVGDATLPPDKTKTTTIGGEQVRIVPVVEHQH